MPFMKCRECGHEYGGNAKFCPECGKPSTMDSNRVNCRKCNFEIKGDVKYCPECGESVRSGWRRRDREDDDDEGGIIGGLGDIVDKLFK